MKQPVIAIIGAGSVGSTAAYALIMHNVAAKILLVDIDVNKCAGEVQDLEDALFVSGASTVSVGSLSDAGQADIIVITAGIPQKPGQTRLELLATNHEIVGSIVQQMKPIKSGSIIIVVTNPVDIVTRYVQEISGLPKNQVFGSGTFLDTNRLCGLLGDHMSISPNSIQAYVLGEHGDNQFVSWSTAQIGGVPLSAFSLSEKTLDDIALKTQHKAYGVIECKGFTAFGVASAIAVYCENIIGNLKRVYPVSCFIEDLGVYVSMPVVLGSRGVENVLRPVLHSQEQDKLVTSAKLLAKQYTEIMQRVK